MIKILCALLFITFKAFSIEDSGQINLEISFKKIAPDTFVITDESYHQSNVLVARMPDHSVLIASSPFETKSADRMTTWIKQQLKPKKIIAINTHFHADGTGGNEAYQKHNVEIWASELTRDLHKEKGETGKIAEARGFESQPELQKRIRERLTVVATNTFKELDGKTFNFAEEKVQLIWPGPARTKDNVVVYFPKRKILFGGCMIKAGNNIGYLGDAVIESWESSAQKLLSLEVDLVIPGHGKKFGGKDLIQNTINLATKAKKSQMK